MMPLNSFMRTLVGVLVVAGITAPLAAANTEVAPFYGYRFGGTLTELETGKSLQVDPGAGTGVAVSFRINPLDSLELLYSHQDSGLSANMQKTSVDIRIDEWQVGINRLFPLENSDTVKPFLVGLLGFTNMEFSNNLSQQTLFSMGLGGGVKYFPRENIGLRLDVRGYVSIVNGSGSITVNNGVGTLHFSGSTFIQGEIAPSIVILF